MPRFVVSPSSRTVVPAVAALLSLGTVAVVSFATPDETAPGSAVTDRSGSETTPADVRTATLVSRSADRSEGPAARVAPTISAPAGSSTAASAPTPAPASSSSDSVLPSVAATAPTAASAPVSASSPSGTSEPAPKPSDQPEEEPESEPTPTESPESVLTKAEATAQCLEDGVNPLDKDALADCVDDALSEADLP